MPKSYPKRPRDTAELAKFVVEIATGERENTKPREADTAAVSRGKARAGSLSAKRRKTIAKRAATARWKKRGPN